jgi:hypothetical protein
MGKGIDEKRKGIWTGGRAHSSYVGTQCGVVVRREVVNDTRMGPGSTVRGRRLDIGRGVGEN